MIPLWLISAGVAAAVGFSTAWSWQDSRAEAAAHARDVNARAAERIRRQNTETAATGFEQAKAVVQTKYVVVTEEIERVVNKEIYRDRMCLDDDGVRAANRALRGLADDPGKPGPTVPAPASTP